MANPIKAVKAIGRAVGGITGKGSKNINPTYKATPTVKMKFKGVPGVMEERVKNYTTPSTIRHMKETTPATRKEAKANARGLKAANKPRGIKYSDAKGKIRKSKNIQLDKEIEDSDAYMKASKQYNLKTGSDKIIAGTANNLKYTPPARPNRIRGGSMQSKLNWPKGMK
jgi:hypothetical protein